MFKLFPRTVIIGKSLEVETIYESSFKFVNSYLVTELYNIELIELLTNLSEVQA
jgi:hypothetical protein